MRTTLEVKENSEGEFFIELPEEILEAANLKEGDSIIWKNNNDGSWFLTKKENMKPEIFKELVSDAGFCMWNNETWKPENTLVDWSSNYDEELKTFASLIIGKTISILHTQKNIANYSGEDNCKKYMDDCITDIRNYFYDYI
jgi:bifunctional DNA-binding transcriptional regulator/antitoxin component of YhaV-PrlF toxin-antitoxin module